MNQYEKDAHAVRAGDDGFLALYDTYVTSIYRFVRQSVWTDQDAQDITSDVFMKAYQKLAMFDERKASFKTWLYRIAYTTMIDYIRKEKKEQAMPWSDDLLDAVGLDSTVLQDLDHKERVRRFFQLLSSEQQQIIRMRVWDGLSFDEIADVMELSSQNCRTIMSRAVSKIRTTLGAGLWVIIAFFYFVGWV